MRGTIALVAVAALLAAPAAVQAEETSEIRVVAHDDAGDCRDEAPCLEIPDNAWSNVYAGDEIRVVFENQGSQAHSLAIVPGEERNEKADTETEHAFLEIDGLEPGESQAETVQVPEGTDTAYLFDEDHEAEGMHLTRNVYPADAKGEEGQYTTMNETNDDASGDEAAEPAASEPGNEAPVPLAAGLIALAAGAGIGRRRSR